MFFDRDGRQYTVKNKPHKFDEIRDILDGLNDALYSHNHSTLLTAAAHLISQKAIGPKFPLVLLEGKLENFNFWMTGIQSTLKKFVSTKIIVVKQSALAKQIENSLQFRLPLDVKQSPTSKFWKKLILQIEDTHEKSCVVVVLDVEKFNEDLGNVFLQLSALKRSVSVVMPLEDSNLFEEMCSGSMLLQFEKLVLKIAPSDKLLTQIISYLTFEKKSVIEFSPYILQMLRCNFLLDGSQESAHDNVKTALVMQVMVDNNLWTTKARLEFAHLVSSYWRIVKYFAGEILVSVLEIHEALQNDSKLAMGFKTPIHLKISNWFDRAGLKKTVRLAKVLMNVCESKDMLFVRVLKLGHHYNKMKFYKRAVEKFVSVESTASKLCSLNQIVCDKLLRPFVTYPNGKEFVCNSTAYQDHYFINYQLEMERTFMQQDNNCAKCYKVLRNNNLHQKNLISIKAWATSFFQCIGGGECPLNWAIFFESMYVMERCGLVSSPIPAAEGVAVINLQL